MKKIFLSLILIALCIVACNVVLAANEYDFDVEYTGSVVADEEKDVDVLLVGTEAPIYNNVRIKVDISGPATPKLIAYDTQGTEYDIAQIGYWGPETGFQVGGTFTNRTPVKAIFNEAGTYTITLSLLDLNNVNDIITAKVFNVNVFEDPIIENSVSDSMVNNMVAELPKAGTSIGEYLICFIGLIAFMTFGYFIVSNNKK